MYTAGANGTPSRFTSEFPSAPFHSISSIAKRSANTRSRTVRACSHRWQSGVLTRVARTGAEDASGLLERSQNVIDGHMHGVRRELLPSNVPGRIDDEDGVAIHVTHVHAARDSKDAEGRTEGMVAVLHDREAQLQLVGKRL